MGRDRQFAARFTDVLVAFNAIECADGEVEVPRTSDPDAYTLADKMARLVEILFYVTKNRKSSLQSRRRLPLQLAFLPHRRVLSVERSSCNGGPNIGCSYVQNSEMQAEVCLERALCARSSRLAKVRRCGTNAPPQAVRLLTLAVTRSCSGI